MPLRHAYAKVNLALSVGPPLPEGRPGAGMHPIASWMHAIDLFDEVEVRPEGPPGLEVAWAPDAPRPTPLDWPPEKDLAWRAMGLLEREAGRTLGAAVRVLKRIPVGGGLGGGSSDAAAALMLGNEAFGLGLTTEHLAALARELGSDVAFFFDGGDGPPRPAVVAGLGDRIARLEPVRGAVVLIVPPFGCPTGAVYRAYDALGPRPLREGEIAHLAAAGRIDAGLLFNDLIKAAEQVQPELAVLRESLRRAGAGAVCMSGSGSTLFVPVSSAYEAAAVEHRLRPATPDAAILGVRLV